MYVALVFPFFFPMRSGFWVVRIAMKNAQKRNKISIKRHCYFMPLGWPYDLLLTKEKSEECWMRHLEKALKRGQIHSLSVWNHIHATDIVFLLIYCLVHLSDAFLHIIWPHLLVCPFLFPGFVIFL